MRRFLTMHDFLRDESVNMVRLQTVSHDWDRARHERCVSRPSQRAHGFAGGFIADVASVAKKDLKPGDVLDGEGGYTVFGRLVTAEESLTNRYLPMGLSRGAKMIRPVPKTCLWPITMWRWMRIHLPSESGRPWRKVRGNSSLESEKAP